MVDFHHFIPHDEVRTACSPFVFSKIKLQMATLCLMTFASIFYSSMTFAKVKRRALYLLFLILSRSIWTNSMWGEEKKNHLEMTSNKVSLFSLQEFSIILIWYESLDWSLENYCTFLIFMVWFHLKLSVIHPPFCLYPDVAASKWIQTHMLRLAAIRRLFWRDGRVRSQRCCLCVGRT